MTHTQWIGGWVLTLRRWMVHLEKRNKWETYLLPPFISEWGCFLGPKMPLCRFQSPAKWTMGWLATCGCFQSESWVITAASPGAHRRPSVKPVEHWRHWISCQKSYRIWLPNCSSSPWLSVINLIRYSFNKKNFTLSLEECQCPLNEAHCQINCIRREMSGQFTFFYWI